MDGLTRDEFIEKNMGLVQMVVNKFLPRINADPSLGREDLVSIGTIGLIDSYDKFNPEFGFQFSTYAVPKIEGEIRRFLRDKLCSIKFSRSVKDNFYKIDVAGLINEKPSIISEIVDIPIQDVEKALSYHKARFVGNLEQPIYEDDGVPVTLADTLGEEVDMDSDVQIEQFINQFNERTRKIIYLRMQDYSQVEIGKMFGISQAQISRTLIKVKDKILKEGGIEMAKRDDEKFKVALKLAKETDLSASEIAEKTGVNYQTAYRYIKAHRASTEEIEEAKNRQKERQAPVTTYQLTPEQLEKYRLDKSDYNPLDNPPPRPNEVIEVVTEITKPKVNPIIIGELPSISGQSPIEGVETVAMQKPVAIEKTETPKVDNGYLSLTIKLDTDSVGTQLESIVKAMQVLGFKDLDITIKSQVA